MPPVCKVLAMNEKIKVVSAGLVAGFATIPEIKETPDGFEVGPFPDFIDSQYSQEGTEKPGLVP